MNDSDEILLWIIGNSTKNIYWQFSDSYHYLHGWLSTVVSIIGLISNSLNIMVLTRPKLVNIEYNNILTLSF
jgi:hypothetical protein